jgi:eukaryotic-like serine/threonine-protein kinase
MPLTTGTRLGPHEILAALGTGGMGEVYKARDTRLDRIVAIKVLPETLADDPQFRERFDREARTISQLDHPNICTLYDVGNQDGVSFLVMQFLEGETLDARLKTRAPSEALPLDESLRIAIQIADALDKAHRAGVVHRDLKPANIFLARTSASAPPVAKLLDFGLAKTGVPAVSNASGAVVPTALPTTPVNITAQAYQAAENQSARPEVFVRPLSDGTVKYQVSAGEARTRAGAATDESCSSLKAWAADRVQPAED